MVEKKATPGQLKKISDAFRGIPREQAQALLGSGLLPLLRDANVAEVNRAEFRRVCGLASAFVHDKTKVGWTLLENVVRRVTSVGGLELVPFLRDGETSVAGDEMARRARSSSTRTTARRMPSSSWRTRTRSSRSSGSTTSSSPERSGGTRTAAAASRLSTGAACGGSCTSTGSSSTGTRAIGSSVPASSFRFSEPGVLEVQVLGPLPVRRSAKRAGGDPSTRFQRKPPGPLATHRERAIFFSGNFLTRASFDSLIPIPEILRGSTS